MERLLALFEKDLRLRRAFVAGTFSVTERELCSLVVVRPDGDRFVIAAEAVYIKAVEPGAGIGFELVGLDANSLAELEAFVCRSVSLEEADGKVDACIDPEKEQTEKVEQDPACDDPPPEVETLQEISGSHSMSEHLKKTGEMPPAEVEVFQEISRWRSSSERLRNTGEVPSSEVDGAEETSGPRSIYERMRKLGLKDRDRVARQGQLAERMALEKTYGSSVWEGLLQNPMLTVPEVAQIARKGTLSQPLVEVIVANGTWLASPEVRRALMSNPRVSGVRLERVLRATPKVELKQIVAMTAYRGHVRDAAKKILSEVPVKQKR